MSGSGKKLVVVLNRNIDVGKAMNALAHAMLGFGAGAVSKEDVRLNRYVDADGGIHDNVSEMPIVVLKARPNKLKNLRKAAVENRLVFVDFTDTMSIGTYAEEYALTKTKTHEELDYRAIILFGPSDTVTELTRKFSVYGLSEDKGTD